MMQVAFWESDRARSKKRPLPDSNRGWRICNPLPYRLAKGPASRWMLAGCCPAVNLAFQLAGQRLDPVAALVAGLRQAARVYLAGLEVVEHYRLGVREFRTGAG